MDHCRGEDDWDGPNDHCAPNSGSAPLVGSGRFADLYVEARCGVLVLQGDLNFIFALVHRMRLQVKNRRVDSHVALDRCVSRV